MAGAEGGPEKESRRWAPQLLEEEHPARVIDRVIELMDLTELYAAYADEGNAAYHPRMMLKVLFYSYHTGLMSCREMWEGLKGRADFIYLSGDQIPDSRTLNAFRGRHLELLPKLFAQIVLMCVKLGMVDFQHLAIDGQKIQANASYWRSKNRARVKKNYERVRRGIAELLAKEPHELDGPGRSGDEPQGRAEAAELQPPECDGRRARGGMCGGEPSCGGSVGGHVRVGGPGEGQLRAPGYPGAWPTLLVCRLHP